MVNKTKPFQKLLCILSTGEKFTVAQIDEKIGKEIYMYRLSSYLYDAKIHSGAVIKSFKDGRKVSAYQIINVKEVQDYLKKQRIINVKFEPRKTPKQVSVSKLAKLSDLGAVSQKDIEESTTSIIS